MRKDGGMNDDEIDEYVVRGYISDTDGVVLKTLNGNQQADYLEAILEDKLSRRDHPHL